MPVSSIIQTPARALPADEREVVRAWRYEQLRSVGYSVRGAARLARSKHVDLHVATDLLRRECAEVTALRILL